jgi:uncharacterized protein YdeI (YjbR/CyaY-like superfamily)
MGTRDRRIDAYMVKSAEFARPILTHLRTLVHRGCPGVTETMKWSMPAFEYNGFLCGMAAFKNHCTFGFWKSKLLKDPHNILESKQKTAMGNLGCITNVSDLPSDHVILGFIKQAARLNERGVKLPSRRPPIKRRLQIPRYVATALRKNPKARAVFEGFSHSHKKEYVEWITEAKTAGTRQRRMAKTVEWLTDGKERNWKYARK